jgi:hypothetical protein
MPQVTQRYWERHRTLMSHDHNLRVVSQYKLDDELAVNLVIVPSPLRILLEHDIAHYVHVLCQWVICSVHHGSYLIPHENHGLAFVIELLQLSPCVIHMSHASKSL